jgi:hypothetical protein
MRKLARLIRVDDSNLRYAVINGLKPHISAQVTQAQPESVDKVLDVVRLAELAISKVDPTKVESTVCQQLVEMQAEMRRLSTKVDKAMTTSSASRSPTPERRVHFTQDESPAPRATASMRPVVKVVDPTPTRVVHQWSNYQTPTHHQGGTVNVTCNDNQENIRQLSNVPGMPEIAVRQLFVHRAIRQNYVITVRNLVIFRPHVFPHRNNTDGVASQLPTMGSLSRLPCLLENVANLLRLTALSLRRLSMAIICYSKVMEN